MKSPASGSSDLIYNVFEIAQTRLIFIFIGKLILNDKILKSDQNYYKLDQMFLHVSLFLSKGNKCIHVQNNGKIKIKMV